MSFSIGSPSPGDSLEPTFGALYLGGVSSTMLFGFTSNLVFDYFRKYYKKDAAYTQIMVALLWCIDAFQVCLMIHLIWSYLVIGYAFPPALSTITWSLGLELGITVTVSFSVRCFYISQLWGLSRQNAAILVTALIFAFGQLALGWLTSIHMIRDPHFTEISTKLFRWTMGGKCVTSLISDVLITASTCYYLHAARTAFTKTNELINLLSIYTINRGVVATLWEGVVLITFLTMRNNLVFVALHFMLGKLHTASLYSLLNHRETLRLRQTPEHTAFPSKESQHAKRQVETVNLEPTNVHVMITSETVVDKPFDDSKTGASTPTKQPYSSDEDVVTAW